MKQKSSFSSEGFAREVLPLIKDGLVVFRSILDTLIERIEEAEKSATPMCAKTFTLR